MPERHDDETATGRSPRPADSVASKLKTPRFLESATVKLGHTFGEGLDDLARRRSRQHLRHVGWEAALDAIAGRLRARKRAPPRAGKRRRDPDRRRRRRCPRSPTSCSRHVPRAPDRLVLHARVRTAPRRGAGWCCATCSPSSRSGRRPHALVGRSAVAALPPVAPRRAQGASRPDAEHAKIRVQARPESGHALPPREDDRDRRPVAFVGGIDLTSEAGDRFDTNRHPPRAASRLARRVGADRRAGGRRRRRALPPALARGVG